MTQATKSVRKTMTVRLDPALHVKLKALVKFKSTTIQAVMAKMAEDFVTANFTEDMLSDEEEVELHPAD